MTKTLFLFLALTLAPSLAKADFCSAADRKAGLCRPDKGGGRHLVPSNSHGASLGTGGGGAQSSAFSSTVGGTAPTAASPSAPPGAAPSGPSSSANAASHKCPPGSREVTTTQGSVRCLRGR